MECQYTITDGFFPDFLLTLSYSLSTAPYIKDDKCLWDPKKVSAKDCKYILHQLNRKFFEFLRI